jgi:8-oxo-dGTP diphosphatase
MIPLQSLQLYTMPKDRQYPDRPIIGVGAVIITGSDGDNRRILLVRRASEPLKGKWSIPGGALEMGETLIAAVQRETLEETGLRVEPLELAGVIDRIIPDSTGRIQYHYVLVDYLCKLISDPADLRPASDVDDARWATQPELDRYDIPDFTRQLIDTVFAKLTSGS